MSVFQTLYDAHVTIADHPITYRELFGNAFGFASAIGGLRRRVWAWPVGIAGNVLLFTVFIATAVDGQSVPLLGQAGRQIFFIAVSIYGWRSWSQARHESATGEAVTPRWATGRERAAYLTAAVASVALLAFVFHWIGADWPAPDWYFVADAWIFTGSILATYAMARGWVDFWLCWIAVDIVGVPELVHFELYPSAALFVAYGVLVIYGFFSWRRIARATPVSDPSAEMAGLS